MSGLLSNAKEFMATLSQSKEQQILESLTKHIDILNAKIRKIEFETETILRDNESLVRKVESAGKELRAAKNPHARSSKKEAVMQIFRKMSLNEQKTKFFSRQRLDIERQISSCQHKQFFFMRREGMKDQIALSMKTSIDSDNSTQKLIDEYLASEKDISFQMAELDNGFERMDSVHNFTSTESEAAEMTRNLIASHGLQDILSEMDTESLFPAYASASQSSAHNVRAKEAQRTLETATNTGASTTHPSSAASAGASANTYSSAELDSILNDIESQIGL